MDGVLDNFPNLKSLGGFDAFPNIPSAGREGKLNQLSELYKWFNLIFFNLEPENEGPIKRQQQQSRPSRPVQSSQVMPLNTKNAFWKQLRQFTNKMTSYLRQIIHYNLN